MTMTKKEKAEFDAAIKRANILAALRWTEPVKKDLPAPEYRKSTSGWDFNEHTQEVYQAWSESVAHGKGAKRVKNMCASQSGISLFSTKLLALKALRHKVELEAASQLLKIDAQIIEANHD